MLTEYRQRFSQFQTDLARAEYLFYSGQTERLDTKFLYADNSDLFANSAVEELRAKREDISEYRENDRDSLHRLIAFALEGRLNARVRELTEEIAQYEARATIRDEEDTISFHSAWARLANEASPQRRRELLARCYDVVKGVQDWRAERLEKLHATARDAGYENYLALYQQQSGVDYQRLAERLTKFLTDTETKYIGVLKPLLALDASVSSDEATRADIGYLQRLNDYDDYFPRWRLRNAYEETLRGLGIRTWQQSNIVVDDVVRPRKIPRAFCSPVRIPDEVRLVIRPVGGQDDYQAFFHEAGHAQHFAWTSSNLLPEFRYTGDYAVTETWAFLFQGLLHEPGWLTEMLGFAESTKFRHKLAVHKLLLVRRYAAKLNYEVELHTEKLRHNAGARYAELLTEGVRVRYDETEHLRDLDDGLYAASYLRAWAFEAQLREHLKTKFGSRWWSSRKAGEMLIDLWNTGQRYSAERLAAMIGLGELSFDWLAAEMLEQIKL